MYNGPDHYENMLLLHKCSHQQLIELMTEESPLGKNHLSILKRDLSHCPSMIGHQGIVNLVCFYFL